MTTGDRLWIDPGGRAEVHAGTTTVRLGGATAASILNLDDDTTQVKLTQGSLQLRVRALPQGQQVEVDTPNLAFVPNEPGDYRIDVSPDGSTTLVSMRHGSAVVYGDSRSITLSRGQRMRFAGTDLADAGAGAYPPPDGFDQWTAARDAREDQSVAARYVPREMTGYAALDDYGDWQQDAGYGAVWFPRAVPSGWAPYSTGHWAWVAPWGWTWIDDAPWGFAPSHYGRWAHFGNRWGWGARPRQRAPLLCAGRGRLYRRQRGHHPDRRRARCRVVPARAARCLPPGLSGQPAICLADQLRPDPSLRPGRGRPRPRPRALDQSQRAGRHHGHAVAQFRRGPARAAWVPSRGVADLAGGRGPGRPADGAGQA